MRLQVQNNNSKRTIVIGFMLTAAISFMGGCNGSSEQLGEEVDLPKVEIVETSTDPASLMLSYNNPDGNAHLFVNGFLVVSADTVGRSSTQAIPYLRLGKNTFEIVSTNAGAPVELELKDMRDGDPSSAPILLELKTQEEEAGKTSASEIAYLKIDGPVKASAWQDAKVVDLTTQHKDEIYSVLTKLAEALEAGSKKNIQELLHIKHTEMGEIFGLSKEEMDDGLLQGISFLKENPEFRVDLAKQESLEFLTSINGSIVNTLRKNGEHALIMVDGDADPGFSASLAYIDGNWVVVR